MPRCELPPHDPTAVVRIPIGTAGPLLGRRIIPDGPLALPLHPNGWGVCAPPKLVAGHRGRVLIWILRTLVLRRFGGRGLLALGLLNLLRRRIAARRGPRGVYEPGADERADGSPGGSGVYQPSQGSSQIAQRRPR